MESLENKKKSNKNLIGHSKEKKQDLSVRTEEKIKTGNTEEKNHVDEIGSMVEGEVAKETVLPSWMCESEAYEPNIDKDGFITKSAQAILGVLAKLKWNAGKDRRFSASPSLKLCYTFLFILLTACSKNYLFSLIMVAGTILALASYPAQLEQFYFLYSYCYRQYLWEILRFYSQSERKYFYQLLLLECCQQEQPGINLPQASGHFTYRIFLYLH